MSPSITKEDVSRAIGKAMGVKLHASGSIYCTVETYKQLAKKAGKTDEEIERDINEFLFEWKDAEVTDDSPAASKT
jgi:hypothetical protein